MLCYWFFCFVWGVVWGILGCLLLVLFYGWCRCFLCFFGVCLSGIVCVYFIVEIWYLFNFMMGENVVFGFGVICYCMDCIMIGDYVIVF